MLYFAYGMNTNGYEMALRCPTAISLGSAFLLDAEFRFARHADIVACDNGVVDGVLWDITDNDLKSLDRLEGFPYYYDRAEFEVEYQGKTVQAVAYFMNPGNNDAEPTTHYLEMLLEGYAEHGVSTYQIAAALKECYA
jgi:gamma-glutamylcyclotransferase (GGCT)/AIG2-like uncharacterized protein YtfP